MLFYVYLSIVLTILSISIFYNVQKDEKNVVKSSNKFTAVSTFTYSTSMFLIIETLISLVKVIFKATENALTVFLINSSVAILVSLIISVIFYFSLSRNKKFINACLVRVRFEDNKETKK